MNSVGSQQPGGLWANRGLAPEAALNYLWRGFGWYGKLCAVGIGCFDTSLETIGGKYDSTEPFG